MPKKVDLTNQKFGKWKVLRENTERKTKESKWICECECGTIRSVSVGRLKRKTKPSRSCGCDKIKHGMADKDERYGIWLSMKRRCDNPKVSSYPYYGGRGIEVCERWMDFAKFCEDMGPRPSNKHSIERIDSNDHYEPSNCIWATAHEQSRNREKCKTETGIPNISFRKDTKSDVVKYRASVKVDGKKVSKTSSDIPFLIDWLDEIEKQNNIQRLAEKRRAKWLEMEGTQK